MFVSKILLFGKTQINLVFLSLNRIFVPIEMMIIMKKYLFLPLLMLISIVANAQDKMVLTSGKSVSIRVVEVNGSYLRFRLYENLQGPILSEKLANIYYVQYENGEMHIFNGRPARTNNYIPYYSPKQYNKPYTRDQLPPSGLTTQLDLYIQDAWGIGFMLRKEVNEYFAWNLIGASYMSGWNELKSPDHYGKVNVRLGGVRVYLPCVQNLRFYADVSVGYSFVYLSFPGIKQHSHLAGFDASAGLQIHKNLALGYNLNFIVNGSGHATYHWGRISFLF